MQVPTCSHRKLQRLGPDREVPATDQTHQADISEGPHRRGPRPVRPPPGVLLRCKARRIRRLDDRAGVGPWAEQRVPHRVRPH